MADLHTKPVFEPTQKAYSLRSGRGWCSSWLADPCQCPVPVSAWPAYRVPCLLASAFRSACLLAFKWALVLSCALRVIKIRRAE